MNLALGYFPRIACHFEDCFLYNPLHPTVISLSTHSASSVVQSKQQQVVCISLARHTCLPLHIFHTYYQQTLDQVLLQCTCSGAV